ncbi:MAG: glycerate kinase [Clostridiales bacterium]|nr:glycerate kinase [Clostridiales bacterium]
MSIHQDAKQIIDAALLAAQPDSAVQKALLEMKITEKGRLLVVSFGKAAWQMAKAVSDALGDRISQGIVITKYDHVMHELPRFMMWEAGHPIPDDNSFKATAEAVQMVQGLKKEDTVLLLISGGGSALFEQPLIKPEELKDITDQLLRVGADITEINTLRKRLSAVKGGKFAQTCQPAQVVSIILSDIIGDPLDMIASGPAYPDSSTCEDALRIINKYHLTLSSAAMDLMRQETPKDLPFVTSLVTGSVSKLCDAAAQQAKKLGYTPHILTASLACEAKEAGRFLGAIAQYHQNSNHSLAFIAGGETVVRLTGKGKGGRNQEIALSAAKEIRGLRDTLVFSLGSDGTDGPTDAAGGLADGQTADALSALGYYIDEILQANDSYPALKSVDGLIMTGPTGTNVNDVSVLLIKRS